jgi:hypothetical protein
MSREGKMIIKWGGGAGTDQIKRRINKTVVGQWGGAWDVGHSQCRVPACRDQARANGTWKQGLRHR